MAYTNFVMVIYFSNSIFFWWASVIFFEIYIIYILWTSYHKNHYPESHYQQNISNSIGIAKILFFSNNFFFWKKQNIYIWYTSKFFLLFSYLPSISPWYNYSFLQSFFYWSIQSRPNQCSRLKDVWIFGINCPLGFPQKSHSENFWKRPSNTSMLESFLSKLGSFSKSCSEQLFCREPVHTRFCKKGIPQHMLSQEFSRNLKTCQAESWRLFVGLKFTIKYRALPRNVKKSFKNLFRSLFSVVLLYDAC